MNDTDELARLRRLAEQKDLAVKRHARRRIASWVLVQRHPELWSELNALMPDWAAWPTRGGGQDEQ